MLRQATADQGFMAWSVKRPCVAALVGAVLACAGSVPDDAEAYEPRVPESFYGINAPELVLGVWTDPVGTETHIAGVAGTGVDWIRADAIWNQVEPTVPLGASHSYSWIFYDRWVERLAHNGLTWLPIASSPPAWARSLEGTLANCGTRSDPELTRAGDYGAFVKALVQRYGRNGSFWAQRPSLPYRPIKSVELFNEPNWAGFWCPDLDPATYAWYAAAGADGAHAADPNVTVSGGGLVTIREDLYKNNKVYGMATDRYLQLMLAAVPSLRTKLDALALHLYDTDPDVNLSLIGWIKRQMDSLDLDEQELFVTEFGWHTKGGVDWVTEDARVANYQSLVGQLSRTDCGIVGISPHGWRSAETDVNDPEHWFGIANANGTLKPAGVAFKNAMSTYLGTGSEPAPRGTIDLCGEETPPDQDGDGVPDSEDDYPLDPTRWDGSTEVPPPDPEAPELAPRTPRAPRDFFGVYVRQMPWEADKRKAYYDSMESARLGSVRDSTLWNHAEPAAPVGSTHTFSWGETDARVLGLAKRGIEVQPSFVNKPTWAGTNPATVDARYAEFMAGYARQYGRNGTFWDENRNLDESLAVSDYEVWSNANQPEGSWDGSASAAEFAATYAAARSAIRAVDPQARVIVPVHAGAPAGTAPDFIRAMVAARPSLAGNIDGVYVQSLQASSTTEIETVTAQVRTALNDTGNGGATLRVGMGWYTNGGSGAVNDATRAALLSNTANRLARSNCGVDGVYADAWTMNETNPASLWDWIGIANPTTGALKASGEAYAQIARSYLGWGTTEPARDAVLTCGPTPPDRDHDGIPDPDDPFPLEPTTTDVTPPQTQIDSGPSGATNNASPSFGFSANEVGSTFQCRIDSGSWASCTSPKAYSSLASGNHTFEVRATDPVGNADASPAARSFSIDIAAPQTQIDSGPSGTTNNASPSIGFSSSESGSTFECRIDAGAWASCTSPKAYTSLAAGNHTFEVRATDGVGNLDTTPASRSFQVDIAAPQTQIDSGPTGTIATSSASLTFSSSEAASTFECRLDGSAWGACVSPKAYSSLGSGSHTFDVRATDVAGNQDSSPATRTFTVDVGAPQTQIDSGPSGATNNASPSFTFSSSEGGSTFECRLDSGAWGSCASPKAYSSLAAGSHAFEVRATDTAGNLDSTPASRSFQLDVTAPQTQVDSGPTGNIASQVASFAFSASEAGSAFECKLDGAAWSACASPKSYNGLADGPHAFEVRATDQAGNVDSSPASRSFTVDAGAPQTQIDAGPSGLTSNASPSFGFTASEGGSTFECRMDGAQWASCASPKSYTGLSQGDHVFEVRATDSAGNTDGSPAQRSFAVDTNAPETQIDSGPSGPTGHLTPTYTFSSNEAGSSFQCRLDNGVWGPCASPRILTDLLAGLHLFEVRAVDQAGNLDPTPASRSFSLDTLEPETTIESGPEGPTNAADVTFEFGSNEPDATFECRLDSGAWTACESPTSLQGVAAGSHVFEARATDDVGKVDTTPASRSFVVDLTPPELAAKGPQLKGSTATFQFAARDVQSGIAALKCKVDHRAWTDCESTHTVRNLKHGRHQLRARVWDSAGNVTTVTKKWKMKR